MARFRHQLAQPAQFYLSCIGSTNLDYRSFGIDYELNTFFYDRGIALRQKQIFEADLPVCRQLDANEIKTTPWQRFMRLFAPVM